MSKDNTLLRLEAALQRILEGQPKHTQEHRKLSVRVVEDEAKLGNGSAYYYPEIIEKIKIIKEQDKAQKAGTKPQSQLEKVRQEKKKETRIKEKYRTKLQEIQSEKEQMAATHHQLSHALRRAYKRAEGLEKELKRSREEVTELRRQRVVAINPLN